MSDKKTLARNLFTNWLIYGANMGVMLVLTPYVARTLGDVLYGVWVLLVSVTGYMGVMEIGVRGTTGRFINYYQGKGDQASINGILNSSILFHGCVGLLIILTASVLGIFMGSLFPKIPSSELQTARWVLVMLGLNLGLDFWAATFSQLLIGRDRFDISNGIALISLIVKAGGMVLALEGGWGLGGMVLVDFISTIIRFVLTLLASRRWGVPVSLGLKWVNRHSYREIFGISVWTFVCNICTQVISYLNPVLIMWMLNPEMVTYYSFANMLLIRAADLISQIVNVMNPEIFRKAGKGDLDNLRYMVIRGGNATMFLGAPMLAGFVVFGGEFLGLWVGTKYIALAGTVMLILILPFFFRLAVRVLGAVLMGLGHYRFIALVAVFEAGTNIALSIILVKYAGLGLYGIALGTALPMLVTTGILYPAYALPKIQMKLSRYLRRGVMGWVLSACIYGIICAGVDWFWPSGGWLEFFSKVGFLSLIYFPLGYLLVFKLSGDAVLPWRVARGLNVAARRLGLSSKASES